MLDTYEQNGKKKLAAIVVGSLIVAGGVVVIDQSKGKTNASSQLTSLPTTDSDDTSAGSESTASATPTPTPARSGGSSGTYKDGTYTATASYRVPHSAEAIRVSLTLKNGAITAASVQNSEGDRESAEYQREFTARYKSHVVGQKIDSLNLNVIAGASDTTEGFNQAVSQISQQAQL